MSQWWPGWPCGHVDAVEQGLRSSSTSPTEAHRCYLPSSGVRAVFRPAHGPSWGRHRRLFVTWVTRQTTRSHRTRPRQRQYVGGQHATVSEPARPTILRTTPCFPLHHRCFGLQADHLSGEANVCVGRLIKAGLRLATVWACVIRSVPRLAIMPSADCHRGT